MQKFRSADYTYFESYNDIIVDFGEPDTTENACIQTERNKLSNECAMGNWKKVSRKRSEVVGEPLS